MTIKSNWSGLKMLPEHWRELYWRCFKDVKSGSEFFHVDPWTIHRWLKDGCTNPAAEKLLYWLATGGLPQTLPWRGFRATETHLILPDGSQFVPFQIENMAFQCRYRAIDPDDVRTAPKYAFPGWYRWPV